MTEPVIRLAGSVPEDLDNLLPDYSDDDPDFTAEVEIQKPQVGELFHFAKAGMVWAKASALSLEPRISGRGEEVVVTRFDLDNVDRLGQCWLDVLHDVEAQERRWGFRMLIPGPAPVGMTPWDPESAADRDQERKRREDAAAQMSEHERRDVMRAAYDELGRPSTSQTINNAGAL